MATTQTNLEFTKAREYKKGAYGEYLVKKFFVSKGYIIYSPTIEGAHGFDSFLYKNGKYMALEIKTKAMCKKYPETGINRSVYDRYRKLSEQYNMPVFIAFVDEERKKIYGNYLSELQKEKRIEEMGEKGFYPKIVPTSNHDKELVYFHESSMITFAALTDKEVARLKHISKE